MAIISGSSWGVKTWSSALLWVPLLKKCRCPFSWLNSRTSAISHEVFCLANRRHTCDPSYSLFLAKILLALVSCMADCTLCLFLFFSSSRPTGRRFSLSLIADLSSMKLELERERRESTTLFTLFHFFLFNENRLSGQVELYVMLLSRILIILKTSVAHLVMSDISVFCSYDMMGLSRTWAVNYSLEIIPTHINYTYKYVWVICFERYLTT